LGSSLCGRFRVTALVSYFLAQVSLALSLERITIARAARWTRRAGSTYLSFSSTLPDQIMRGWNDLPAWLRLLALTFGAALLPSACESGGDRFECGAKVDGNVTQCDEEGQVCICSAPDGETERKAGRCAKVDRTCETTSYRFVFGNKDCISGEDAKHITKADPATPDNALCPLPHPAAVCGVFDADRDAILNCSAAETCVCGKGGGLCAIPVAACASGYAANGDCLKLDAVEFVRIIGSNGLCGDGAAPEPQPCGGPDRTGRLQTCAEGFVCHCVGGKGSCAREVESTICASKLLYETDGGKLCASEGGKLVDGVCGAAPIDPVACGVRDQAGRIGRCAAGESCACQFDGSTITGSCVKPPDADDLLPCSSGFQLVSDHQCLELGPSGFTSILAANQLRCPSEQPNEVECGKDPSTECTAEASVGCSCSDPPRCLIDEPGCDSGLAYAGTRRCADGIDREQIQRAKPCPGGEGGDGGGGEGGGPANAGAGQGGAW
jgi:hypothetical protein